MISRLPGSITPPGERIYAMKLAEALQERADLNRKIDEIRRRLDSSILVQEGEKPPEDPKELLRELDSAIDRLETLMAQINITNSRTRVQGMSLTEIIARKDALLIKLGAYRDIVHTAGQSTSRARGTEIKVLPLLKASELQKTADSLAKEARLLDNLLQDTNWKTKLIEK